VAAGRVNHNARASIMAVMGRKAKKTWMAPKTLIRIREEVLGLTRVELGEALDITARHLSNFETGAKPIPKWMKIILTAVEDGRLTLPTRK
jgi:DNA-binding transcriptional regulator YiaG